MCHAGDLVLLEFTVFRRNDDSSGTRSDWVEMDTRPLELLSRATAEPCVTLTLFDSQTSKP